MKNLLRKVAIIWIAALGIIGLYKERLGRVEEKEKNAPQQKQLMLDDFEISSFHNN
jgi:hypothetical protein